MTPHLDPAAAEEIDRDLARLTRRDGRLALALGETMERFARLAGPAKLGYSSRKAYTTQVVGQPARWVGDMCALARRLQELPLTRAALAAGTIGRSMAALLAGHATPETELALLLEAKRTTVARMKERLANAAKQAAEADDSCDDEEQPRSTIETTVPLDHVWAYEGIKLLMASAFGVRGDEAAEYLLAEAAIALSMLDPELDVPVAPPRHPNAKGHHEQREMDAACRKAAEEAAEPGLDLSREEDGGDSDDDGPLTPIDELSDDVYVLHQKLKALGMTFGRRDLELGQLADTFWAARGWKVLGYATETQYCRERLGLSKSSVRKRIELARDIDQLPAVTQALEGGRIGFEAATMIARHAHTSRGFGKAELAREWVERARARTVVHLREELDVAKTRRRLELEDASLAPPDEAAVQEFQELRAMALKGEMFVPSKQPLADGFQLFVTGAELKRRLAEGRTDTKAGAIGCQPPPAPPRLPSSHGDGPQPMRRVRLNLPDDLARWYRRLNRDWQVLSSEHDNLGTTFLEFLCMAMATSWRHIVEAARDVKWADIYARDGYRCVSPVCTRSDVTLHHLRFRSRGGGHEASNTASLCSCCHLELVHDRAAIRAEPPAETIRWLLGKVPQLEVLGRELKQAA